MLSGAGRRASRSPIFPGGARPGAESPEIGLLVGLMRPRSRGTLRLESADPGAPPRIRPGHFSDPADQRLMRTGLAMAGKLAATSPLSRYLGQADDADPLPAFGGYQHPCGTCRMGPAGDPAAVTGADGQVHGVPGAFVADASVMPRIPAANTNLPVLAVAEHLSETL